MRIEDLDFDFPQELIAQRPAEPRDSCRLMHLTADGAWTHKVFSALPGLLQPGDMLVFNDSRVLSARVQAHKSTGGAVEVLFLRPADGTFLAAVPPGSGDGEAVARGESWEVLARPSHRLRVGGELVLPGDRGLQLQSSLGEGRWVVEGPPGHSLVDLMESHGTLPLPPYIKTYPEEPSAYQTVYATELGSAAAPTAGLHFTPALLQSLAAAGIRSAFVTLHVGLDTFQPIREAVIEEHRIHRETYYVGSESLRRIRDALAAGVRLVAIGTTAARVLETLARDGALGPRSADEAAWGETDIFITPGHTFRAVDALLTNLHLPRSSVLALTMAFAGVERLRAAYREAVAQRYRFFSFGDAMLIERREGESGAHV